MKFRTSAISIEKMYDYGYRYAIKNTKTGKWIITHQELYDACYGIKKKLKPYSDEKELRMQLI